MFRDVDSFELCVGLLLGVPVVHRITVSCTSELETDPTLFYWLNSCLFRVYACGKHHFILVLLQQVNVQLEQTGIRVLASIGYGSNSTLPVLLWRFEATTSTKEKLGSVPGTYHSSR